MDPLTYLWLFLAGLGAGFINSMAGGGSVLTLPILTEAVGATVANGTNRIAILMSNVSGGYVYARGGKMPWRRAGRLIPAVLVGAGVGAGLATQVPADGMRRLFAIVVILVAITVLIKPSRWLEEGPPRLSPAGAQVIFFLIGVYGGFIQVGVGFMLLAGLVLGKGFDLISANAAKLAIIAAYSLVALPVFLIANHVDILLGLVMGMGNMSGSFFGARMAVKWGPPLARWVLIVAAVGAGVRMLFA